MDETVEDGVSQGGISDGLMPMIDGKLARDDGEISPMPILEDFQQIPTLGRREDRKPPIIEDENVESGDSLEHAGVAPVAASESQRFEEAWHPVIGHAAAIAASLVTERAGNPIFPEAGLAGNQKVLVAVDPGSVDQMRHDAVIDAAGCAQIEILDTGGLAQGRELQAGSQRLGIALGALTIHEQAEPILES